MTVMTGGKTRLNIQFEDTYGSAESSPTPFVPGANTVMETNSATNNGTRITLPASKVAVDVEEGVFDGAWALSWGLTNVWMLRSVYGAPSTVDNSDGSFTHTYSAGEPDSFQILLGYEEDTDDELTISGCVTARFVVNPQVTQGEFTQVTAEGFYSKAPSYAEDTTLTSQDTLDESALDFGDATLKRGGSTEAIVQNASLELAWDPIEPVLGFGSRFATDFMAGLFSPTISYTKVRQDAEAVQDVYGSSTSMQEDIENTAQVDLEFSNNVSAGSGINEILFEGAGDSFPESHDDAPLGNPRERIDETLNRIIQNMDVKATNETSTAL